MCRSIAGKEKPRLVLHFTGHFFLVVISKLAAAAALVLVVVVIVVVVVVVVLVVVVQIVVTEVVETIFPQLLTNHQSNTITVNSKL